MNERIAQPTMITTIALAAYGALLALALIVASWWGIDPWAKISWTSANAMANLWAVAWGVVATVPLLILLVAFDRRPPWPLVPLKQSIDREVVPLLERSNLGDFLLISLAAGFGEELFFRGVVQVGILQEFEHLGGGFALVIGIACASIIFGACHWINHEYAIVAGLIGVYLGVLFAVTDNLLTPIVTHALYDFLAMWYLVILRKRMWRRSSVAAQ